MSITTSLAAQSAIMQANRAELDSIRLNQAQQNLLSNGCGDFNSLARKENAIEMQKEQASIRAKTARAQQQALKNKNKLNVMA